MPPRPALAPERSAGSDLPPVACGPARGLGTGAHLHKLLDTAAEFADGVVEYAIA